MPPFVYRCPNTALQVQGWFEDTDADNDKEIYQGENCPACSKIHFVDPKTGKILNFEEK